MKQTASNATRTKTPVDVELALRWAWRDELSKRATSAAENVWDRIEDLGRHGGVDVDDSKASSQRYAHIGEPDPDALALEQAVAKLEPVVIDWSKSLDAIAGPLAGLVSVNDFKRHQPRTPKAGWGKAGDRALRGWFGPGGERPLKDRPRDIMMIGTFQPKTLLTVHAAGASRPDWRDEEPKPTRVLSTNGKNAKVEGKCEARDRYSLGAFCPLEWDPSPTSVILARADYVVWWEALQQIAETVELTRFTLLPPAAPAEPWFGEVDNVGEVITAPPEGPVLHLPLTPTRGRMLAPFRRPGAGQVYHLMENGKFREGAHNE
jgi:hypothetical protein